MKGRIEKIINRDNKAYGFIIGDDGKNYYFDDRSISNHLTTNDFCEDDPVEFDVIVQSDRDKNKASHIKIAKESLTEKTALKVILYPLKVQILLSRKQKKIKQSL